MFLNLEAYPKTQDVNVWADYIELKALIANEEMSVSDIVDSVIDENFGDREAELDVNELDEDEIGSNVSEIEDQNSAKIKGYFTFMSQRSVLFGDAYPFNVQNGCVSIKRVIEDKHYGYLFLLLASNLKVFGRKFHDYTKTFELLSLDVLNNIFGDHTKIYYFGKGNAQIASPFTQGSFFENLQILAKMLNITLAHYVTKENVGRYNVGDGGLDIVGYVDLKDKEAGMPSFFVQCACGQNWEEKQLEAHAVNWERYLHFQTKPQAFLMTPKSLRNAHGMWINPLNHKDVVFVDRFRFLNFMTDTACASQKAILQEIV